jgi:hypothetical protein
MGDRAGRRPAREIRRYLYRGFAVHDVADAGILWAFCCVVDTLSEQCRRCRLGANLLVAAVFRIKQRAADRSSATCQQRRSPCPVGLPGGGLEITAVMRGRCAIQHDRDPRTELGFRGCSGAGQSDLRGRHTAAKGRPRTGADAASYRACACRLVGYVSNGVRVAATRRGVWAEAVAWPGRCGRRRGLRSGAGALVRACWPLRPSSSAPE